MTYACGVKTSGQISCWGSLENGDEYKPLPPNNAGFVSVSIGTAMPCGLKEDWGAACWGPNVSDTDSRFYPPPQLRSGGVASAQTGSVGAGEPTSTTSPTPAAPANLAAAGIDGGIALNWDDAGDPGITNYQYRLQGSFQTAWSDWQDLPGSHATTSYTITGLANDAYRVQLRALANGVAGPHAEVATTVERLGERSAALPGRVSDLTATASQGSVSLDWTAPADGGAVTGYRVLRRAPAREPNLSVLVADTGSVTTAWTDENVEPATRYIYRVEALNDIGVGAWSLPAQVATPVKPNVPATGAPSIIGTAQVGKTLTADTSAIADADGLDNASFSYLWLADDVDIAGATSSAYTLTSADEGKAVKVRVSFTDDAGNDESLTSAATDSVAAKPPPPLTASFLDVPKSHDGKTAFTFELRFTEGVALSFTTLRDHVFVVVGGDVTAARRQERPTNIRWLITLKPYGDQAVTVVLPKTTADCDTQGAICTGDGRKLSNRSELTVPGPGG